MNGVSIIVPVIHKEQAVVCKAACKKHAHDSGIPNELLFVEDTDGIGCPKMVKMLTDNAQFDTVCFIGDDTIPQEGFLKKAVDVLQDKTGGKGVVFFHDGINDYVQHCHFLASKEMLPALGGEFFHTGYSHCFCDSELAERAVALEKYAVAGEAIVLHDNPVVTATTKTDTLKASRSYSEVYAHKRYVTDEILFGKRRANGWTTPGPDYFRVGIGVPLMDKFLDKAFFISFVTMEKSFDWAFQIPMQKTFSFSGVRNGLLERAILDGCTHQIQLDTDQIYKPDTLVRLLQHRDRDIVGTRVHRRYPPFDVLMFRGDVGKLHHVSDEECFSGKLVKVCSTGTGCIMINLSILPDIPAPWFREGDVDGYEGVGEDIYFTSTATKMGKEVYVDTSIDIDHITQYLVNGSTYHLYKGLTSHEWRPESIPAEERMTRKKYRELILNEQESALKFLSVMNQ